MVQAKERQKPDFFEMYQDAFKSWLDIYGSWNKTMGRYPSSFVPPQAEDWARNYRSFADAARAMQLPFELTKDVGETMARTMSLYSKTYDIWFRGMAGISSEWYDLYQKVVSGKPADATRILDAARGLYDRMSTSFVDSLKNTPFAGVEEVDRTVRQALDSMPAEKETSRKFMQQVLEFNIKAANTFVGSMKDMGQTAAHVIEKGTLSGNGYEKAIQSYADLVKGYMEVVGSSGAWGPGASSILDDVAEWVKANLELTLTYFDVNLKLYGGLFRSVDEIYRTAEESFRETRIASPDQLYTAGLDIWQKAMASALKNSEFFEGASRYVQSYTSWLAAASKLYHDVTTPPFVTKDEVRRLAEDLQKIRSSVERKSSRAKVDEPAAD